MKPKIALLTGVIFFAFSLITKSDTDLVIAHVWFAVSAMLGAKK